MHILLRYKTQYTYSIYTTHTQFTQNILTIYSIHNTQRCNMHTNTQCWNSDAQYPATLHLQTQPSHAAQSTQTRRTRFFLPLLSLLSNSQNQEQHREQFTRFITVMLICIFARRVVTSWFIRRGRELMGEVGAAWEGRGRRLRCFYEKDPPADKKDGYENARAIFYLFFVYSCFYLVFARPYSFVTLSLFYVAHAFQVIAMPFPFFLSSCCTWSFNFQCDRPEPFYKMCHPVSLLLKNVYIYIFHL